MKHCTHLVLVTCFALLACGGQSPVSEAEYQDGMAEEVDETGTPHAVSGAKKIRRESVVIEGFTVSTRLFDVARGFECAVSLADDGVMRCLPMTGSSSSAFYADAMCSQPLFFPDLLGCNASKYGLLIKDYTCPVKVAVVELSESEHLGQTYQLSGDECAPASPRQGFRTMVKELPASDFVSAELVVEQ